MPRKNKEKSKKGFVWWEIVRGIFSNKLTLFLLKLLIFLAIVCYVIYWVVFRNPIFYVNSVVPVQVVPVKIRNSLYGQNIFSISLSKLYLELEKAFPMAKTITIEKVLPDKIKINIVKRKPVVFIRRNGIIYPVDAEGVVLAPTNSLPRDLLEVKIDPDIPLHEGKVVESEGLFSALDLLKALKETGLFDLFNFVYINALQPYELCLKIKKGPVWKIRGGNYKQKLELFKKRLLKTFLEDLPHLKEGSYLLFLDDGTITLNP